MEETGGGGLESRIDAYPGSLEKKEGKKGRKKEEEEVERGKGMRQRGWSKWKAVEGKGN